MDNIDQQEMRRLKDSALEHLWIYGREPSEMAEKGGPRVFVDGKGCVVKDEEGREYIDGHAGLAVRNIGYGRPEIADAVYEQMKQISYMPWGSATVPSMKLAEKLAQITPGDLSRVFFTSGGSEANETAIKLARGYHHRMGEPTRYRFISRKSSYHGATMATLSLGGGGSSSYEVYEPVMPGVIHVPSPDPYKCPLGGQTPSECSIKCANAVDEAIQFYGAQSVAAVIAEPMAASTACAVPGDEYWPMLRDICDRHGVLLIADEVVTGFGRTGKMFACQHWDVTPDVMSVGKGFTSGYLPMSGAIARKPIADVFVGSEDSAFRHIFTHGGHPACAAAALENVRILEDEDLVENSATMGEYLLSGLYELKEKHAMIGDARGKGLFAGVVFTKDRTTKEPFPADVNLGARLNELLFDNGLILSRGKNHLIVAPPLCISRSEVDEIISIIDKCLNLVEKELSLA